MVLRHARCLNILLRFLLKTNEFPLLQPDDVTMAVQFKSKCVAKKDRQLLQKIRILLLSFLYLF
jgi:hypothetical protein